MGHHYAGLIDISALRSLAVGLPGSQLHCEVGLKLLAAKDHHGGHDVVNPMPQTYHFRMI